jgi:hypothetical protein
MWADGLSRVGGCTHAHGRGAAKEMYLFPHTPNRVGDKDPLVRHDKWNWCYRCGLQYGIKIAGVHLLPYFGDRTKFVGIHVDTTLSE